MAQFEALSKTRHLHCGVQVKNYQFAITQSVVPLTVEELPHALPTMAMAFVASGSASDAFELVALQSFQRDKNVYVHVDGRWITGYRPAWYRAHPFRLVAEQGTRNSVVAIDTTSDAFLAETADDDYRLFSDDGEPTRQLSNVSVFLEKYAKSLERTRQLVSILADAGVIVPWDLKVRTAEGEQTVQGLFHIDEAALKTLDERQAALLLRTGAGSLATCQLLSEHRLPALTRLYELRAHAEQQNTATDDDIDIEALFADNSDDNLTF